jgi:transposase InsO family protein
VAIRWSIEEGKKKRRPPTADQVKFLAAKPDLDRGGFELARAYAKLSTERNNGMTLGPIRISKVWEWMDRTGIANPIVREHVEATLMAVDAITLKRANRPTEKPPAESGNGRLPVRHQRRRNASKPSR